MAIYYVRSINDKNSFYGYDDETFDGFGLFITPSKYKKGSTSRGDKVKKV